MLAAPAVSLGVEPVALLPIEPDPVVPEAPDVPAAPVEPAEPVDGAVVEPVEPLVPSVFLLQPPSAKAAARTSTTAPADFSVGAYIAVSFEKLERLNVSQLSIYLCAHRLPHETRAQAHVGIFRAAYQG